MVRRLSKPQAKISVVVETRATKANHLVANLHDLNAHLNLENSVIAEDFVQRFSNKTPQPIFFERLHNVTLSRSQYQVTSFIDFGPYKYNISSLIEYANSLIRSLHHYASKTRYSPVNNDQPITYEEKSRTQSFHKILTECIEEVKLINTDHQFTILIHENIRPSLWWQFKYRGTGTVKVKMICFGSIFRWLFAVLMRMSNDSKIMWTSHVKSKPPITTDQRNLQIS